jgi:hypothetical protein
MEELSSKTTLSHACLAVVGAAGPESRRYALNGVLLTPQGEYVATDGTMIAVAYGPALGLAFRGRVIHRDSALKLRKEGKKAPVSVMLSPPEATVAGIPSGRCFCTPEKTSENCTRCRPPRVPVEPSWTGESKDPVEIQGVVGHFPPWDLILTKFPDPDQSEVYEVQTVALLNAATVAVALAKAGGEDVLGLRVTSTGLSLTREARCGLPDALMGEVTLGLDPPVDGLLTWVNPVKLKALAKVAKDVGVETLKMHVPSSRSSSPNEMIVLWGDGGDIRLVMGQMPLNRGVQQ